MHITALLLQFNSQLLISRIETTRILIIAYSTIKVQWETERLDLDGHVLKFKMS